MATGSLDDLASYSVRRRRDLVAGLKEIDARIQNPPLRSR